MTTQQMLAEVMFDHPDDVARAIPQLNELGFEAEVLDLHDPAGCPYVWTEVTGASSLTQSKFFDWISELSNRLAAMFWKRGWRRTDLAPRVGRQKWNGRRTNGPGSSASGWTARDENPVGPNNETRRPVHWDGASRAHTQEETKRD